MRKAGVLMPVSALPSRIGAGELGESAFHFIELLKENHVKIWQILPLNPVGYGNSPYQPYSSCAGDELYIIPSRFMRQFHVIGARKAGNRTGFVCHGKPGR